MRRQRLSLGVSAIFMSFFLYLSQSALAVNNTYSENFDNREANATINDVDSWTVNNGLMNSAVVQNSTVYGGTGKAMKLTGDEEAVNVSRRQSLGNVSPAWIEYVVKPAQGNQTTPVPTEGIGAVTFSYTGAIMVSDGPSWVDTGLDYTSDQWYRVQMKLDFSSHTYDVYISPAGTPKTPFVADKLALDFIDPSINAISEIGFGGIFNPSAESDDVFVDDLLVHFVQRLEIITPLQTLAKEVVSNAMIVQLQNANSEPQTAWKDITLTLTSTTATGQFSASKDEWQPITQIVIPEGSQEATFYYKDSTTGKPIITVKESPDIGFQEALHQVTIVDEIRLFDVAVTTPQIAGVPFSIQITARQEDGQINTTYNGSLNLSAHYVDPGQGAFPITPETSSGFVNGVLDLLVTYADAGTIEIEVEDSQDDSKRGVSGQIKMVPASFSVTTESAQKIAKDFSVTVKALNSSGAVTPNYKGPAKFEAIGIAPANTGGGTMSPGVLSGEHFQNGIADIANIQYNRWGTVNLKVSDQAFPDKKGESGPVMFTPSNIIILAGKPPEGRDYFYSGEPFNVTVSIVDFLQQPVANYTGDIALSAEPSVATYPADYSFLEADQGKHNFLVTPDAAGSFLFQAESMEFGLSAQSLPVQVKQASVEVISTVSPVGTAEVEIQLVDEKGKRITTESNVSIMIQVVEEDPNGSVFSSDLSKPVEFKNGVAKVVIGNTQAEKVTIAPQTKYGFRIKTGTITFGKVGKSGIGTLMWWESKDDEFLGDDEAEAEKENKKS